MTQSERRFSCSIGIDMGAKYTGVFYALFDREELPTNLNSKAMTLVMPETGPRYVQAQVPQSVTACAARSVIPWLANLLFSLLTT